MAEAAEAALDAYLIKPYTSASLADRLAHARHRKRVLKDIFEAIEKQDFEGAAAHCLKRFNARAEFWLYAARIGAELLLRLNRHEDAHKLYDAIIEAKGLKQMSDSGELEAIIDGVLAANAKNVEEVKAGNAKAFNALVGQAMKATKGKANPAQVNELLKKKLG